ncbi:MAG: hypothetical protein RMN25_08180, partial [Anaerolineae bacterium]|nr:hypothetical protein [Thermoflexales bacterium]MDW8407750.1 hypothetical protein [Anaerolineae bacterium]
MARALSQLAVLLTATACAALPLGLGEQTKQATPIPLDLPATTQAQLRDFELLVNVLRRQHINPRITDEKWLAEADAVRSRIVNGISAETYLREIEKLVEQLNDRSVSIQAPAATPTATNTATTTFSGIGVLVGLPEPDKERLVVLKVYRGSPAEQAGIRPHDSIVAID